MPEHMRPRPEEKGPDDLRGQTDEMIERLIEISSFSEKQKALIRTVLASGRECTIIRSNGLQQTGHFLAIVGERVMVSFLDAESGGLTRKTPRITTFEEWQDFAEHGTGADV